MTSLVPFGILICAFLLTCLLRGMTDITVLAGHIYRFLLTCLLRGMTNVAENTKAETQVSTHMPLARHDKAEGFIVVPYPGLYFNASGEAGIGSEVYLEGRVMFLLTCLLRGMTE